MKQADINRLNRATEHLKAAIVHMEKVRENTEGWQAYRAKQHLDALCDEKQGMESFLHCMRDDPDFQHKDFR